MIIISKVRWKTWPASEMNSDDSKYTQEAHIGSKHRACVCIWCGRLISLKRRARANADALKWAPQTVTANRKKCGEIQAKLVQLVVAIFISFRCFSLFAVFVLRFFLSPVTGHSNWQIIIIICNNRATHLRRWTKCPCPFLQSLFSSSVFSLSTAICHFISLLSHTGPCGLTAVVVVVVIYSKSW